ncbi:MAG TPA: RsmB/NOP family class I SAM-dependent RNA methyltransferase [Acidiferrobacter sp.]|nr:RsmB/NOP family class I SAM-dependent RNA methyltransferase [Acidiferrobacter sp.]
MITRSLSAACATLLTRILTEYAAADTIMDRFFRSERRLGPADRGVIAETVYGSLRHYRMLSAVAAGTDPLAIIGAFLAIHGGYHARQLAELGIPGPEAIAAAAHADHAPWPFAIKASLPDWLARRLTDQLALAEAAALGAALLQSASLDVRTNTLKTDRETLRAALLTAGHELTPTPFSPWGLRRALRAPLFRTPEFAAGHFEVQDEGSQLIAPLIEPRRGERVLDYCAGAGGKTLHLSALMNNGGTLYACDTSQKRLQRLKERVVRAGLDNVRILAITGGTDTKLKRLHGKIDRVLVDAPCSGTGTLRRSPDIKWRLTEARVTQLATEALEILLYAARLVRPGGRVVYATCSLLNEENEDVIREFLAQTPSFRALATGDILTRRGISLDLPSSPGLRLWPHLHGTDGFFAQALERVI